MYVVCRKNLQGDYFELGDEFIVIRHVNFSLNYIFSGDFRMATFDWRREMDGLVGEDAEEGKEVGELEKAEEGKQNCVIKARGRNEAD